MKNRNAVSLQTNASDSFEVYTADVTPENHDLHVNQKVPIPTIRLTQATPSDISVPSIIAPKSSPRRKIVPKKSKLALLSTKAAPPREKDLSDILRRVNASTTNLDGNATCNVTVNGGTTMKMKDLLKFKDRSSRSTIDIYVDPADDPDIGEIVVVKKKKSRAKLDGLFDVKGNAELKEEPKEESKWWSIRGRKKERLRNHSLNTLNVDITEANTVLPEARQRCGSTPLSPSDSGYGGSIALRAMKSIARIGSWAQLKNSNLPRETHQVPSSSRVKSSISSFEIGALSTHTGEDLTNKFSPMGSLSHCPPGSHRFLNPSITNTSLRTRTSSNGTVLSVTSPYLQPCDNRRLSTSSSSGESNRPGSTYTASGEDTGALAVPVKSFSAKSKKSMSVKWGSVSSALALTKGKKKSEKEKLHEKDKAKERNTTSKGTKRFLRSEDVSHLNQTVEANGSSKDKEDRPEKLKGSHRHTVEGRKRTHVMNVFPGLTFGRSTDLNTKISMPPIAEDPNRSCKYDSQQERMREPSDRPNAVISEESWPTRNNNISELSDSDSDLSNREGISDEEACVRLSIKNPREVLSRATAQRDAIRDGESSPARPKPRPRPASEQLLGSAQIRRGSRPVGMVVDVDIDKYKNREDALVLSVLEAANSDLASLINRLDLEATPDKDRDITTTYAHAIAAWRASGSAMRSVGSAIPKGQTTQQLMGEVSTTCSAACSPSDIRCSVFRENHPSHEAQGAQLTYRDPIATIGLSADIPSSVVGESFAFIDSAKGVVPEESPLRLLGKVRAITRAMGAATGATGGTMSKRFSAISASTRASVTSLRPYALSAFKNKDENMRNAEGIVIGEPRPTLQDETVAISYSQSKEQEQSSAIMSSELNKEFEGSSRSSVYSAGVSSALPTQSFGTSFKGAAFNRMSRASSITSTFGTRAVLAKTQLRELTTAACSTPKSDQAEGPSCKTFGAKQKPLNYALPPLDFGDGRPASFYANQFGTKDTPTPPTRARGHIRQSSGLVPLSQRPVPQGNNVRRKVEYIEQLTRFEHEQEEQKKRKDVAKRCAVKHAGAINRPSTSSRRSDSSRSCYSSSLDEGVSLFVHGPIIARDGDSGFVDENEQLDSDIPSELKDALSASDQSPDDSQDISLPDAHPLLCSSSTPAPCHLPPSPGLPPTSPLPIPESKSVILPTPTSTNDFGITMEPSPPAPSFLPVIDPSPSPETPSSLLPTLRLAPPFCEQAVSDHGDVEEFIPPRIALSTSGSGSEDDTKQSFDFTGELKRLNESGGSHRLSFVEQLDAAFKTPPHVTARGGFEIKTTDTKELTPALVSTLEGGLGMEIEEGLSMMVESLNESMNNLGLETSYPAKPFTSLQTCGEVMSKPSYGRLDTAFKFGGRPPVTSRSKDMVLNNSAALKVPISTLPSQLKSDELPRRPSICIPTSPVEEDSSVLRSIYVHAAANDITQLVDVPAPDVSDGSDNLQVVSPPSGFDSNGSSRYHVREEAARAEKGKVPTHARQSSDVSFLGFSSFGAIRTKFEFGPDRPDFYSSLQTPQASMTKSHLRHESLFSIASVSSYGEVIKPGMTDPFRYGDLEDEEARDQLPGLDSFSGRKRSKRLSTDSDISSFYFRPGDSYSHTRNHSVLSTNSINGPPISLYNRTFNHGHRRNDSGGSMSSVAAAYNIQGANGGRAAWMRHQQERSVDSAISEFSRMRLGRPGVGDKMFESTSDHYPLSSISASPSGSVSGDLAQKSSYDSILDDERRSTVDSIFDNTGHRSSISSDSVFWHEPTNENDQQRRHHHNLFPPTNLFRPLSLGSTGNHGTSREDDTMITMLGGEHVRRRSLGSSFEASPCFRVEKQKRGFPDMKIDVHNAATDDDESSMVDSTSPTAKIGHTARFKRDELGASAKSIKFGETRMDLARKGLLHRESLEDSCLSADGEEDLSMISTRSKAFSRPAPRRQRKPVVTITHPPDTTPPLSSSDGSGESQSSIDVEKLSVLLQTAAAGTRSSATRIRSGSRIRAPGQGHRRRTSQVSKGSVICTIQEEVANESPRPAVTPNIENDRTQRNSLESSSSYSSELSRIPLDFEMVENQDNRDLSEPHIIEHQEWDEERWVIGLRKYYALRSEADEEIMHSRTMWPDTPFSLHALHTFVPPRDPVLMQALLEHSVKNYVPLPIDRHFRKIRSRASSITRSAPYTRPNSSGGSSTRSKKTRSRSRSSFDTSFNSGSSHALRPKSVNNNIPSPRPTLAAIVPFSPFPVDLGQNKISSSEEESFLTFSAVPNEQTMPLDIAKPDVRPRVPSATRRTALGWSKRKTKDEDRKNNKENEAHGILVSPSESLRIIRPRPRSRVIVNHVNAPPRSMVLSSS